MSHLTARLLLLAVVALTAGVVALGPEVRAAKNSEQIVFSGTGTGTLTSGVTTPFGFWIWCEDESDNPYAGECNSAMYFYALPLTKHVDGTVTELDEGKYQMQVESADGTVTCTLTNTPPDPWAEEHRDCDVYCADGICWQLPRRRRQRDRAVTACM